MVIESFNQMTNYCQQNAVCTMPSSSSLVSCKDSTMWFLICGWPHPHAHLHTDAICYWCKI